MTRTRTRKLQKLLLSDFPLINSVFCSCCPFSQYFKRTRKPLGKRDNCKMIPGQPIHQGGLNVITKCLAMMMKTKSVVSLSGNGGHRRHPRNLIQRHGHQGQGGGVLLLRMTTKHRIVGKVGIPGMHSSSQSHRHHHLIGGSDAILQ